MIGVAAELPSEVFDVGVFEPHGYAETPGHGVPAGVVLRWIDESPWAPWIAAMLDQIDPRELDTRDLPLYVKACDRYESHAAALKSRAIATMAGPADSHRGWSDYDPAANETSVALRISLEAAHGVVWRARRLVRVLPGTLALFDDGKLTAAHVRAIVNATAKLSAEQCAAVEAAVLDEQAEHLSVRAFARRVRRVVAKIDPRDFARRHREAADESYVDIDPDNDAMAWLTARMPLVDALVVKQAVDAYAANRAAAGDRRATGVLRAEALRVFAEAYLTGQITGAVPTAHGRPIETQICITPEALLGLSDTPAEIPGVGPIPADVVREMIADTKIRWLIVSGDDGRLLHHCDRTWRPSARTAEVVRTRYVNSVGPHSDRLATRCQLDHNVPWPAGPTDTDNLTPLDGGWHLGKTHGRMQLRRRPDGSIEWTTPLGQTCLVRPYDYRLGP